MQARRFTTVFTTNFDDLLSQALSSFLQHTAVVCNADAEVDQISFLSDRAKIIKLNGDYLFVNLKNTVEELRKVGESMAKKFAELARQRGLVVLGYSGGDENVMSMIATLLDDPATFPHSIFWGLRPGETATVRVVELTAKHPDRFRQFECPDFDAFMADLNASLGLELPTSILRPHTTLEGQLSSLIAKAGDGGHAVIQADCAKLRAQLGRPVEAELALSQRSWALAIDLAQRHVAAVGASVGALTVWGNALLAQAGETGREDLYAQASAKLKEAIALDDRALAPRYAFARLCTMRKATADAIDAHEALLALVPDDTFLRRNLVTLYAEAKRYTDAEREVRALLARDTRSADDYMALGSILASRGQLGKAIEQMEQAVRLAPNSAQLHFQLGQSLWSMQRFDEAEAEVREAVRLSPDNIFFVIALSDFMRQRQKPALALTLLEEGPARDTAEVQGRLADLYLEQGRPADAEKEARAALIADPGDARLMTLLGLALLATDKTDDAEDALRRARDLNPGRPQPHWWLAEIYVLQGRHPLAEVELRALGRDSPQLEAQLRVVISTILQQVEQNRLSNIPFSWRQFMPTNPQLVATAAPTPPAQPTVPPRQAGGDG